MSTQLEGDVVRAGDDGVVLDLSPMKGVQVDPTTRTARAGAGLLLGELDRATQEQGSPLRSASSPSPASPGSPSAAGSAGSTASTAWQSGPDAGFPSGRLHYWKAGWLRDLTDASVTTLLNRLQTMPSSFSGIGLQHMGGAAARAAPAATAFARRAEPYLSDAVYVNNLGRSATR